MPRLQLYAAGSNSHGQLGIGHEDDAHTFQKCNLTIDIGDIDSLRVKICAGANHTLLFVQYGQKRELYVVGSSTRGQLGQANESNKLSFEHLELGTVLDSLQDKETSFLRKEWTFKDVAAGWETSFFLLENRDTPSETLLLASGSNDFGQLGTLNAQDSIQVLPLPNGQALSEITSGPRHTIATSKDGQIYGWGASRHGQLGQAVSDAISYQPRRFLVRSSTGLKVGSVAAGHQHTCIVAEDPDHQVHIFGNSRKGQLGTQDTKARKAVFAVPSDSHQEVLDITERVQVVASWNSSFVLDQDTNTLYSFGNNASGQLGREGSEPGDVGTVEFGESGLQRNKIVQVAAGSEHCLAMLETASGDREAWGWGWNEHGNLGMGENVLEDVRRPVRIDIPERGIIHSVHAGNGTSWIAVIQS